MKPRLRDVPWWNNKSDKNKVKSQGLTILWDTITISSRPLGPFFNNHSQTKIFQYVNKCSSWPRLPALVFTQKSKGLELFYCLQCQIHSQLWWRTSVGTGRHNQWKEDLLYPQEILGKRNLYASLQWWGAMSAHRALHYGSPLSCKARGGSKPSRHTAGRQEGICLLFAPQGAILVLLSQKEWPFPVILLLNDLSS